MTSHSTSSRRAGARLALLLILSVALSANGSAQNPQGVTLSEAIAIALENNHDLRLARLDLISSDARVDEAFGNALPTVDLNARYTLNIQRPVFFFPGEDGIVRPIEIGSRNALAADITVQQIIFNSAVLTGVGTAETYAKVSRQQLRMRTAEVIAGVKRAYYSALFAREVQSVNETLLANAEANYQNTKLLFEAGVRAEFDAIRAEVAVANQRPRVIEARNTYESALDNLRLLLGYEGGDPVALEPVGDLADPSAIGSEPSFVEAATTMRAYNSTLESLRLIAEVNKGLIDVHRSEYLPTVAFFGSYKYEGQADNLGDFDFQPSAFAGLNLSLNLYNGGKTEAKVAQARVAYDKSRFDIARVDAGLTTQLEEALRRIDYARERIAAGERTIGQAERAYSIATTTYKAGTGTQLQINDADLALAQARLNRLNAVFDYNLARVQLELLLGKHVLLEGDEVIYRAE